MRNGDYHPGNRSKQVQETHTISMLTEKQHPCMASQTTTIFFYIQTLLQLLCEFLGTVWAYCRGDNPHYIITSPTTNQSLSCTVTIC